MLSMHQIAEWARNRKRPTGKVSVQWDEDGITQIIADANKADRLQLAWDRVLAAYGFKRDCVSTDQICLLIGDEESDRWIEVREDDTGYKALIEELPIRIPGFPSPSEWWQKVTLPPFKTQWTQLYRRHDARDQK